jgi:threonine synthase
MDPHTATCLKAYGVLNKKPLKSVICSTAEWTKFAPTIYSAIKKTEKKVSDYDALEFISKDLNTPIVRSISELFNKDIVHDIVIDKDDIEDEILKFIAS